MSSEVVSPPSRPLSHTKSRSNIMSASSSNLRDTLSSFGDDLVRIKDSNFLYFEGNGNSNIPGQYQNQSQIQFERVPSSEVGVKSSRWRKAIVAGLFASDSSTRSKHKVTDLRMHKHEEDSVTGMKTPPFWGVGPKIRGKISMLSLQLVLHELSCFASPVLLGCLIVQLIKGNAINGDNSWVFNRTYESIVIFLMGLAVVGFLMRIDTTDPNSLLTSPFHILPSMLIVIPIYLVKAWELQHEECLQYLKMGDDFKKHVHLTQNCDYYDHKINGTSSKDRFRSERWNVPVLIMNIGPIFVCFILSVYLFSFRNRFYLIEKFGRYRNRG